MRLWSLLAALSLVLIAPLAAQDRDFSKVEVKAEKVAGSIYMLTGAGGNIAVSIARNGRFDPKIHRRRLHRRGLHAKRRGGGIEHFAITQRVAEPALSPRKPHAAIGEQLRRLVLARTSQVEVRWNLLIAPRVQQFR